MSRLVADFVRHNNWANLGLIDFLAGQPQDLLTTKAPGTFGDIQSTLLHLVGSLARYHEALTGRTLDPERLIHESRSWPGFAAVREAAESWGRALEDLAETASDDWRVGRPHHEHDPGMSAAVPLVQALNHCADHRSQIATALALRGIEPPDLDGWAWGWATGRVDAQRDSSR